MSDNENSNFQKMSTIKNNPNIEPGKASELNKIFFNVKFYIILAKRLYNSNLLSKITKKWP